MAERIYVPGVFKKGLFLSLCLFILIWSYLFYKDHNHFAHKLPCSRALYDRNGTLLRLTISTDEKYRLFTGLDHIPDSLVRAVILKEDRFFFFHPGTNPFSLFRACMETYMIKKTKIGGSTITMQLVRLYYRLNTKTIPGKLYQILMAFWLELHYTKQEILSAYLNLVPCGGNIEGYPAAALIYFGKPVSELTFSEVLLLASIPQHPIVRTPGREKNTSNLLEARKRLFDIWVEKYPEDRGLEHSLSLPLDIKDTLPFETPHFLDTLLKRNLENNAVTTTIDSAFQNLVERHAADYIRRNSTSGVRNTAIEILDYQSMELLASLGAVDYFNKGIDGQVDGTEAFRSPGSTLKPFIYARAFDMGLIHPQTMLKDAPTSFGDYTPDNYLHDFKGPVSAETALITSRNIPAITLAREISNPDLYDMLHMVGIPLKSRKHYGLSIVLGGAEVRMRDLIRLYACLANRGLLKQIKEIRAEGDRDDSVYRLFSHASAYITCSILAKNYLPFYETRRFGKNKDQPVAFKTGTSIGFKDCWSIGIFDNLIIAVWIGNFDGYGNPAFIGRKMAAPLMFEIIDSLRRNNLSHPTDLFETIPDNVTEVEVCQVSGRIKGEHCTKQATTLFIPRVSPIEKCKIHRLIYIDPKTGFQTTADNPDARGEVWEFWTSDLLQLFQQAGLPRRIPPPFPPHTDRGQTPIEGFAPKIVSPLTNTEYVIRFDVPEYRDIPLQAIADADIDSLYWFVNKRFIGVCSPDETLAWEPDPGTCAITVVDSRGRSDTREITISQVK